jgi:WD40 repeat protein
VVWDVQSGKRLREFAHAGAGFPLIFSPDGSALIMEGATHRWTAAILDRRTGVQKHLLAGHTEPISAIAYSPDGKWIATGSDDCTVRLWDAANGTEIRCFQGHSDCVHSLAWSPDSQTIASGASDATIVLWDVFTQGTTRHWLREHDQNEVDATCFSPDGNYLLVGYRIYGKLQLWNVETGAILEREFESDTGGADNVAFSPDGKCVAATSYGKAAIWSTSTGKRICTFRPVSAEGMADSVRFSPDGHHILSVVDHMNGVAYSIAMWNAHTGEEERYIKNAGLYGGEAIWTHYGVGIVGIFSTGHVRVWSATDGKLRRSFKVRRGSCWGALGSDGRHLVISDIFTREIEIWDLLSEERIVEFDGEMDLENIARVFRLLAVNGGSDVTFIDRHAKQGTPIAWFSSGIEDLATHPSGRIWAGKSGKNLQLIRLEGNLPTTSLQRAPRRASS